jgi:hypothetical protein
VLSLLTQGFRQLMVAEREAVANDMVDLLGDSGIQLWVDEDPMATFSSALFNVFGLPAPAEPLEEQEADETVREQAMRVCLISYHLIRSARVCLVAPQGADAEGDGQEEEEEEEEESPAHAPT